jgi:hypothetical protein
MLASQMKISDGIPKPNDDKENRTMLRKATVDLVWCQESRRVLTLKAAIADIVAWLLFESAEKER